MAFILGVARERADGERRLALTPETCKKLVAAGAQVRVERGAGTGIGVVDEAFADVAGTAHLFGPPVAIAQRVRERVKAEVGLPISVGVARTKHLAKIASQVAKPDGLCFVDPATELEFLHDLPVELMWGVGPATKARLAERGIVTIGQLANTPGHSLEKLLGPAAGVVTRAFAAASWSVAPTLMWHCSDGSRPRPGISSSGRLPRWIS